MSKQNKILISVIIPSYNRAETVGETIESIMVQEGIGSAYDLEIVIGDDCSTDNAREVLEQYRLKYPDYIRLFLREENVGLGANWAMCVKDCQGKYICNCDNDDYWHNTQKLLLQLEYMENHPNCNMLFTNHRKHNRTTGEITEYEATIRRDRPIQEEMYYGKGFCNATLMYRADFMKQHLDLDEFIRRRFSLQDWPAWVILAAYSDVDVLPVSTATFGVETVSITRPQSYEKYENRLEKDNDVVKYLNSLFPTAFPYSEDMWIKYKNYQMLKMAYRKNDYTKAHEYAKLSQPCWQRKLAQTWLTFKTYQILKLFHHKK